MFDKGFVQQLKQSNISVDAERSSQRLSSVWKAASRTEQSAVLALAGVARASVQRAYKTGNVSAKLVISFAQIFNLSPLYLTGESDEQGENSEQAAFDLLRRHGYSKLLLAYTGGMGRRPQYGRNHGPADGLDAAPLPPEAWNMAGTLSEDDLVLLLRSVLLRAKAGGHYAELSQRVKQLLLS